MEPRVPVSSTHPTGMEIDTAAISNWDSVEDPGVPLSTDGLACSQVYTTDFDNFRHYLQSTAEEGYLDILEVFGGAARTTSVAVRRRLRTGKVWDITLGMDLTKPEHQLAFMITYGSINHS